MAISPQLEKYGHSVHRRLNLGFDVLTRPWVASGSRFGLVFVVPDYLKTVYLQFGNKLDEFHGENAFRLPMPARYIVDQQSVIRSANVSPDYTIRPDPVKPSARWKNSRKVNSPHQPINRVVAHHLLGNRDQQCGIQHGRISFPLQQSDNDQSRLISPSA